MNGGVKPVGAARSTEGAHRIPGSATSSSTELFWLGKNLSRRRRMDVTVKDVRDFPLPDQCSTTLYPAQAQHVRELRHLTKNKTQRWNQTEENSYMHCIYCPAWLENEIYLNIFHLIHSLIELYLSNSIE